MAEQRCVAFFDVDNTLIDNDAMKRDLDELLKQVLGEHAQRAYHDYFEALRHERGYADFLGAVQQLRLDYLDDPRVLSISSWLLDYPFSTRVFPGAFDAVRAMNSVGVPVILSDGDAVYQPHKIARSGLDDLFEDRMLVFVHKEQEAPMIEQLYPAEHYVVVDDKLKILTTFKELWGARVTTIFVRQGHYGTDAVLEASLPAPDHALDSIGELVGLADTLWL
jgi:phosphoglycolate phosphatase-like HAD superfamily hydrolase